MNLLLNVLIALICGFLADYICTRFGMDSRLAALIGLLVGVVVFLANPAGYF